MSFRSELQGLINAYRDGSAPSDLILAEYIDDCLAAYENAARRTEELRVPRPLPKDTPP